MGFGTSDEQDTQREKAAGSPIPGQFQKDVPDAGHSIHGEAIVRIEQATGSLANRQDGHDTRLADAERRLDGIAEELSKTNARMDVIDADRAKHKAKLDGTLEEIMEAAQEAEKAWAPRMQRLEEHGMAMSKNNANLKRDLDKAKGED